MHLENLNRPIRSICEETTREWVCKPGSVRRSVTAIYLPDLLPGRSSGLPVNSHELRSSRRGDVHSHRPEGPLDLAPGGVCLAAPVARCTGGLLHHRFTLTAPGGAAVCSLWHCPAGHPGWVLPTTLLCGVRTFLGALTAPRPPGRLIRPTRLPGFLVSDTARATASTPRIVA